MSSTTMMVTLLRPAMCTRDEPVLCAAFEAKELKVKERDSLRCFQELRASA
jgi:hypothetical protein